MVWVEKHVLVNIAELIIFLCFFCLFFKSTLENQKQFLELILKYNFSIAI